MALLPPHSPKHDDAPERKNETPSPRFSANSPHEGAESPSTAPFRERMPYPTRQASEPVGSSLGTTPAKNGTGTAIGTRTGVGAGARTGVGTGVGGSSSSAGSLSTSRLSTASAGHDGTRTLRPAGTDSTSGGARPIRATGTAGTVGTVRTASGASTEGRLGAGGKHYGATESPTRPTPSFTERNATTNSSGSALGRLMTSAEESRTAGSATTGTLGNATENMSGSRLRSSATMNSGVGRTVGERTGAFGATSAKTTPLGSGAPRSSSFSTQRTSSSTSGLSSASTSGASSAYRSSSGSSLPSRGSTPPRSSGLSPQGGAASARPSVLGGTASRSALGAAREQNITDEEFTQLQEFIYTQCGIFIADTRKYLIENRLSNRLRELNLKSFNEYYYYLRFDKKRTEELQQLFNVITTNETSFYRNPPQLKVFQDVVVPQELEKIRASGQRKLRIWSAGCSTGEEPYTLAIILSEVLQSQLPQWDIKITANDLSENVLRAAQRGIYSEYALRTTPPEIVDKYFTKEGMTYHINPALKRMVSFGSINLSSRTMLRRVERSHIIFCRNVIIYFDEEMKRQVIESFYDNLLPGGCMLIGHSESLHNLSRAYTPEHYPGTIVYRKQE